VKESELVAELVRRLRGAGWFTVVLAQDIRTRRQLAGLPDIMAWRNDTTLLIEAKGEGGQLRESQIEFMRRIREHEGLHLYYLVVHHPFEIGGFC